MPYIAHSRGADGRPQELEAHLRAVAAAAREFATPFGAGDLAAYAGLWHDIGKYSQPFQEYLMACDRTPHATGHGPDHKVAGTGLAMRHAPPLALLVQGHHGGLRPRAALSAWLAEKTTEIATEATRIAQSQVSDLLPITPVQPPAYVRDPLAGEMFMRMLFSALVDADCLDTEAHFNPDRAALRGSDADLSTLWERFEANQKQLLTGATGSVDEVRARIYHACLHAASQMPGLFRLTVPTGGGKTRSGMAFALRHALLHGLRRVIVVVPYITITEQTADTYRAIFQTGDAPDLPVVLEHHSALPDHEDPDGDFHAQGVWQRLVAENWDAPVIVTTAVQFFQSLFSCKTRGTRKLHRLARSVIMLDEAQMLPPTLLTPILDVLRELCAHYGASVVLSTATQPAFDIIPAFATLPAREIVPDPIPYFAALRRVTYEWRLEPPLTWEEIADLMRAEPSALAVVNTRRDAHALLNVLADPDALHLSTLLCGAHRRQVIAEVKRRLSAGLPCRLVATQVVEAGVDLDFPLVLRALAPLDSIIQAAGRCNREGRLARGRTIVFQPAAGGLPPGAYRTGVDVTGSLLGAGTVDPDAPDAVRAYFARLFARVDLDARGIQSLRRAMDYPAVAERFRMIEEDTQSVVVACGSDAEQAAVRAYLNRMRAGGPGARALLRRLQPYIVSLRAREARRHAQHGWIAPVIDGLGEWLGGYDAVRGLVIEDPEPDAWVI